MQKILITIVACTMIFMVQSCDAVQMPTNASYQNAGTVQRGFGGNYSNQGDENRSGVFTIQLSQTNGQLSGTATYEKGDGESSGVLSVEGNVDGDVANLAFYDQKGNEVARGVLSLNESRYSFIQNSASSLIPGETIMNRY